jgi:hypothetical protein
MENSLPTKVYAELIRQLGQQHLTEHNYNSKPVHIRIQIWATFKKRCQTGDKSKDCCRKSIECKHTDTGIESGGFLKYYNYTLAKYITIPCVADPEYVIPDPDFFRFDSGSKCN